MGVHLAVLVLACGLVYIVAKALYSAYIAPLSRIPTASVLAHISRLLWTLPLEVRGRLTLRLPSLHAKHGPLVRIGPNEISFYSLEVYNTVYGARTPFTKDPRVYAGYMQEEHPALFSVVDPIAHSQRRRSMGRIYGPSTISALGSMMTDRIAEFNVVLNQQDMQAIELVEACQALEADIVSASAFGEHVGATNLLAHGKSFGKITDNKKKIKSLPLYTSGSTIAMATSSLESLKQLLMDRQDASQDSANFENWTSNQFQRLTSPLKPSPAKLPTFIEAMIHAGLPPQLALLEARDLLGPGTNTTSTTLAHILWALAHDTEFQDKLVEGLERAGWPGDLPALEKLPRLKAAVQEGIRWTAAACAMLPRIVPEGGVVLCGQFLPKGTVLGTNPAWYLHDPTAFPSPELYRPERWLNDNSRSAESNTLRDQFYIPWSKGPSTCIGIQFAHSILYLSVSQILKTFRISLAGESRNFQSKEARLPDRLEWISAIPTVGLEVEFHHREVGLKSKRED